MSLGVIVQRDCTKQLASDHLKDSIKPSTWLRWRHGTMTQQNAAHSSKSKMGSVRSGCFDKTGVSRFSRLHEAAVPLPECNLPVGARELQRAAGELLDPPPCTDNEIRLQLPPSSRSFPTYLCWTDVLCPPGGGTRP